MFKSDYPSWPQFSNEEISAVERVLASGRVNYWTGQECKEFEKEFSEYIGAPHAISLCNGTMALELALHALGIAAGDEVIVPSRTFIATASSVARGGSIPVVANVDPFSQNITAKEIEKCITDKTRAIIPVHLSGWPCDMGSIMQIAQKNNLKVIEDCAQAVGGELNGKKVGSFGHAAAFSFCQDKIISTGGEGGMLLLQDEDAWKRAWAYKDHGKDYELSHEDTSSSGFKWLHKSFGTNMRMTEMQAAIGRIQLKKLPEWIEARNKNAEILRDTLSGTAALNVYTPDGSIKHAYYRFYAFLQVDKIEDGWNRNQIVESLQAEGVPCFIGSCSEIYREEAFSSSLRPSKSFQEAKLLGDTSLAFLVHPTISEKNMKKMAKKIYSLMSNIEI